MKYRKDYFEKALEITGAFEGTGYNLVTGNFDGQGLSAGILQWNYGSGSLQKKILRPYIEKHGASKMNEFFPQPMSASAYMNREASVMYIKRFMFDEENLSARWKASWKKFLESPEVKEIQGEATVEYANKAQAAMEKWGMDSERAFCWFFDVMVQNGSLGLSKPNAEDEVALRRAMEFSFDNYILWKEKELTDEQRVLFIASYLRALQSSGEWRQDVMSRKGTIAIGEGKVHRTDYKLTFQEPNLGPVYPDFGPDLDAEYLELVKLGDFYIEPERLKVLLDESVTVKIPWPGEGGSKEEPIPEQNRNYKLLAFSAGELGVKEIPGVGSNKRIEEYHRYAEPGNDKSMPDEISWCSSFLCFCCEQIGMQSVNSRLARSWLAWGIKSKSPLPGDIIVFSRGAASWQGHVGVFLRENPNGSFMVLSGNMSDEVNISQFDKSRLLGIRRSSKAREYSQAEKQELWDFADDLIEGRVLA